MRLHNPAFELTSGIVWGAAIFLATVWLLLFGFKGQQISTLDHFYFGYSFSYVGAVVGAIWGFIDGAIATDVRVMLNMEAEREETFTERAIRTRMIDRNLQLRASGYAEFCLGDPVPLAEVVAKVVTDLDERMKAMDSTSSARDVVYESLRRNFPCEAS